MFKKNSEQLESLDQPLLDRGDEDGEDDDLTQGRDLQPPVATNVGILGVGPTRSKGYARVVDADESDRALEDARVRAERMNALALEKQKKNQVNFEAEMRDLEDRVVREAKERARIEENDRLLALRLQQEEGGQIPLPATMPPTTTMIVTVPAEARGGQLIAVQVPGHGTINIMVPRGLNPGDQFNFRIPTASTSSARPGAPPSQLQQVAVRVPRGVGVAGTFRVLLPTNRIVHVGVPAGVREGDMLRVQYDETTGTPNTEAPSRADMEVYGGGDEGESIAVMESIEALRETAEERAAREAFLSALPEDVRREVLAQETAQKRHLTAFGQPPVPAPATAAVPPPLRGQNQEAPLTPEQIQFLQSLPADLRAEVERDLRAQNAREGVSARADAAPTPSRPATTQQSGSTTARPAPPPPAVSEDADLLGLGSTTSAPSPSAPPMLVSSSSVPSTPPQAPMDMFQNLSVRGVNKDKSSRSQQI